MSFVGQTSLAAGLEYKATDTFYSPSEQPVSPGFIAWCEIFLRFNREDTGRSGIGPHSTLKLTWASICGAKGYGQSIYDHYIIRWGRGQVMSLGGYAGFPLGFLCALFRTTACYPSTTASVASDTAVSRSYIAR